METEKETTPNVEPKSFLDIPNGKLLPMDEDQTRLLMQCIFFEMSRKHSIRELIDISTEEDGDMKLKGMGYDPEMVNGILGSPLIRIMIGRLPGDVNITFSMAILLSSMMDTPGESVMWAWTLFNIANREQNALIDIDTLTRYFPTGFPSDEQKREIWDHQKGHTHGLPFDNLLDQKFIWSE